jgi:hypothetical protein
MENGRVYNKFVLLIRQAATQSSHVLLINL